MNLIEIPKENGAITFFEKGERMKYNGIERRGYKRLKIPGASIRYKQKKLFFPKKAYPVHEVSRAGVRFLSQEPLKGNGKISLKISIPNEHFSQKFFGKVIWASQIPSSGYEYQIGVQFNPYGDKKGENHPRALMKIIALEQKLSNQTSKDN